MPYSWPPLHSLMSTSTTERTDGAGDGVKELMGAAKLISYRPVKEPGIVYSVGSCDKSLLELASVS